MMGCVGSGEDFCGLGRVQKFWVGLGFEKVTHDQLCTDPAEWSLKVFFSAQNSGLFCNLLVSGNTVWILRRKLSK